MDKDHRLDAPDNDSLKKIEQVGDRSDLTAIYPTAHHEWEGQTVLSKKARADKRDDEQLHISLTIRKWFIVIGLLIPMPLTLAGIGLATIAAFAQINNSSSVFLPGLIATTTWLGLSYLSIKKVYAIFYAHSLSATPFISIVVALLLLSLQGFYVTLLPYYGNTMTYNSLIFCAMVSVWSIIYSGLLLYIWTSPRIKGTQKIGCICAMAVVILLATLAMNAF